MFPMTYSINRVSINPDIKPASPAEFSQPIVKKTYSEERLSPVVNTNNPANQYLQEAQPSEELNGFVKTKSIFYTDKRPNMQDPQPFSGQNVEYRIDPNAPVYSSQPKDYSLLRGSAEDMPKADVAVKYPHLPSAVGQNAEEELDLEVVPNQRRVINTNSIPQLLQPQTIEVTSPRKINRSPASVTEVVEVVPSMALDSLGSSRSCLHSCCSCLKNKKNDLRRRLPNRFASFQGAVHQMSNCERVERYPLRTGQGSPDGSDTRTTQYRTVNSFPQEKIKQRHLEPFGAAYHQSKVSTFKT